MTSPLRRAPARYIQLLCDALGAQGIEPTRLLCMAGIDAARFSRPDAFITLPETAAFLRAAQQLSGRSDLGFELGRQISMTTHDLLGFGMLACSSFDQVSRLVSRHFHLLSEQFSLKYQRRPGGGESVYTPLAPMPADLLHFLLEVVAVSHANAVRLMVPAPVPAYEIRLSMPAPAHHARYLGLGPAHVIFDEAALPGVRVRMPAELLDRPLPLANARLLQQIDERCEALARRPGPDACGWGAYVAMMLRDALGEQTSLEQLARHVNVSPRTIVRHLGKENLLFSEIAERVRFERARALLQDGQTTVAQTALHLGFSNAANFSRAFRRVLGTSPGQFRQQVEATGIGRSAQTQLQ